MKETIVIDFHCLLKGVDCTDSIEQFPLNNLEQFEMDEKITDFCKNFRLIIYHPKANDKELYNKMLDYLINKMVKFAYITNEVPVSTEFHRVYNLVKVKESIFLLREIQKGMV